MLINRQERDKALIALNTCKWEGRGTPGVVHAVVKTNKENNNFWKTYTHTNEQQVAYARLVFANVKTDKTRETFYPSDTSQFITLARNPDMTPLIADAFETYLSQIKSGDSSKAADYAEICIKYHEAKAIQAAEGPFTPQLTPGQSRLIEKFEAKAAESGPRDTHKPNENAVTYVYLLGKMIHIMEIPINKDAVKTIDSILAFIEMHGDKTTANFQKVVNKYPKIVNELGIDIAPMFAKLLNSTEFVTAAAESDDNKYLINHALSLKRLYRMVHMYRAKSRTPWALLQQTDSLIENLIKLHTMETAVNLPDKKSLAIIWYLCIGRNNMNCVMVGHHECSAANVMAAILGKTPQQTLEAADYAFPFDISSM